MSLEPTREGVAEAQDFGCAIARQPRVAAYRSFNTAFHNNMKTISCILFVSFIARVALCQEPMTPELFRKLVSTPGDTNALRSELASLPFWREAKCSNIMKYQDGTVFKEEGVQTAKTIDGTYIVFSFDSKYYKQTIYGVAGYDEKASAIKEWGLFGDTLTEETMNFDLRRKISSATSTYGDGFLEISVGSSSDKEMTDRALVFKKGVLFMTRETTTWPIAKLENTEHDNPTNGSMPIDSGTNQTPSATGSRR